MVRVPPAVVDPDVADPQNEASGIDPKPLRKKIADILDQVYREADDSEAVEVGGSGRNASRGRRAQGEPGRAVSAGVFEGRDTSSMPRASAIGVP